MTIWNQGEFESIYMTDLINFYSVLCWIYVFFRFGVVFKLVPKVYLKENEEKKFDIFLRPSKDVFRNDKFEANMMFDLQFKVVMAVYM